MIIDLHEKYDVYPEWFGQQLWNALEVAEPAVVEKLTLPCLCTLLFAYRVKDEVGGKEAANRIKVMFGR